MDLPIDVMTEIFTFLKYHEIRQLKHVSKLFFGLTDIAISTTRVMHISEYLKNIPLVSAIYSLDWTYRNEKGKCYDNYANRKLYEFCVESGFKYYDGEWDGYHKGKKNVCCWRFDYFYNTLLFDKSVGRSRFISYFEDKEILDRGGWVYRYLSITIKDKSARIELAKKMLDYYDQGNIDMRYFEYYNLYEHFEILRLMPNTKEYCNLLIQLQERILSETNVTMVEKLMKLSLFAHNAKFNDETLKKYEIIRDHTEITINCILGLLVIDSNMYERLIDILSELVTKEEMMHLKNKYRF